VRFQGGFDTCAAHVAAALFEYFERRSADRTVEVSRLFLYKVAKSFLGESGNVGVYIRQTLGVMKLIGVPAERYWPYPDPGTLAKPRSSDPRLDLEPTPFCYAVASDSRATAYYRLDDAARPGGAGLLPSLKAHLAAGLPVALGFPLYASLSQAKKSGKVPFPAAGEAQLGSHAVVAVGYDDTVEIANRPNGPTTRGALLILNSWSTQWGERGYGWLPYEFVSTGRARDLWTLLRADWIESGAFQLDDEA
jgi:C1A family cysteine protease